MLKRRLLASIVICVLVISLLPILLPTPVVADSATFYASKDNYMSSGHATTNYGGVSILRVGVDSDPETHRSLLEFDIDWGTDIPDDATITAATLELYIELNNDADGRLYFAQRLRRLDWSESTSTWNNYKTGSAWTTAGAGSSSSDYTTSGQASKYVPAGDSVWMSWDILAQVQYAQTNTVNVACRIIDGTEVTEHTVQFSSIQSSNKPKLTITYTTPAPPTVTTGACTDIDINSFTANGEVTDADGQTIIRRGFTYMEGEAGDPADVIEALNPSFEAGTDEWTAARSTLAEETTIIKSGYGTKSLKVTGTATSGSAYAYQNIPDWDDYKGEDITFGAWVYASSGNNQNTYLCVYDGVANHVSSICPKDDAWHWLTITADIDVSATIVWLMCVARHSGSDVDIAYFDGGILIHDDEILAVYEDDAFGEATFDLEISGLDSATSYRVRAFAQSDGGIGYGSSITGETLDTPSVTTLDASNVASTSARLNSALGDDGGGDCTIKFGWGLSSESAVEDYDSYETLPGTYNTGAYPYLDVSELLQGYTYYFRVSANNGLNATGDELTFETEATLSAPTNFIGYPEATSISLSWSKGVGSTNTLIRYGTSAYPGSITAGTYAYSGPSSTYTVEGLTAGTTYYFSAWGESGGNYSASYATLLMTTSGSAGDDTEDIDVPGQPSRWFNTDYTAMSGLGLIYDGYNSALDFGHVPRATGWFLTAVGLAALFGLLAYLKLGKKMLIGMIVLTVVLAMEYFLKQVPWWLPLMTLILVIVWSMTHKQVQEG